MQGENSLEPTFQTKETERETPELGEKLHHGDVRPVTPGSPPPPTGVRGLRNEGAAGVVLPCAANRWRTDTRLGCGQRWQAGGGEKTRCALALRQVTAGGRPSRGAELKARCRLPEDMCEAHLRRGLRGRHRKRRANDQKAKAVGNGGGDRSLGAPSKEERRSGLERSSEGRRRCLPRAAT